MTHIIPSLHLFLMLNKKLLRILTYNNNNINENKWLN